MLALDITDAPDVRGFGFLWLVDLEHGVEDLEDRLPWREPGARIPAKAPIRGRAGVHYRLAAGARAVSNKYANLVVEVAARVIV